MKRIFFFLMLFFINNSLLAQQKIAVKRADGSEAFYSALNDALTNASSGDVITLSGGTFSANTAVNTKIHLRGAGWHPSLDSTGATNKTVVIPTNGIFTLTTDADGSTFEGFQLNGSIIFGQQNDNSTGTSINNVSFLKCNITGNFIFRKPCSFVTIAQSHFSTAYVENIANDWRNGSLETATFMNNAIDGYISLPIGQNNFFKNNIFFYVYPEVIRLNNNSTFDDNIFNVQQSSCNGCTFNRNINISDVANSTVNPNNYTPQSPWDNWNVILENPGTLQDNGRLQIFDPTKDYRLKAAFRTANPNVANVGIYYGDLGWKTVPSIPWIYEKTIPTTTNANGQLPVIIKVKAQKD